MIHAVFSIHDSKAGAYLPPFILPRVEMAQRTFGDCINSADHQFGAHPEDYTLFELGHFDDDTGQFNLYPEGISLGNGVQYVRTDSPKATEGLTDASEKTPDTLV